QELVRRDLNRIDRESLMATMAQLMEGTQEAMEQIAISQAPPQAQAAQQVFLVALESWNEGLGEFEVALLDSVDQPQSPLAERDLGLALTKLRVGDSTYEGFLDLAAALRSMIDVEAGDLPSVAYVEGDPPIVASSLAQAARRSPSLALVVDVGISAVRITPEEISEADATVSVIPATETIDVQIVVANHGNRPEEAVRVALTLTTDGGNVLFQDQQVLAVLAPGGQNTAMFAALPVTPSEAYDLSVAITKVAEEDSSKLDNNFHRRRFFVNDAVEA
ncbi:MAG: hypothetical protein ACE5MI_10945, partial [Acidimicrobiia bacterium]